MRSGTRLFAQQVVHAHPSYRFFGAPTLPPPELTQSAKPISRESRQIIYHCDVSAQCL